MSDGIPGRWVTEVSGYPETVVSTRGLEALVAAFPEDGSSIERPDAEDVAFLQQQATESSIVRNRPQGRVGDGERPKIVRRPEARP